MNEEATTAKAARREARRREIVEAAERVFGRAGYWNATTADIASEVGITQPALYRYFSSKRELFLEALAFRQADIQAAIQSALATPGTMADKLAAMSAATESIVLAHPELAMLRIQAIAVAAQDEEVRAGVLATIDQLFNGHKAMVAEAQREGSVAADVDPHVAAASITGLALFFYVATTVGHPLADLEPDREPMVARLVKMLAPRN